MRFAFGVVSLFVTACSSGSSGGVLGDASADGSSPQQDGGPVQTENVPCGDRTCVNGAYCIKTTGGEVGSCELFDASACPPGYEQDGCSGGFAGGIGCRPKAEITFTCSANIPPGAVCNGRVCERTDS